MLRFILVPLLVSACTLPDLPDTMQPSPEPTPTPTPCPTPPPPPEPAAGLFNAPDVVPIQAPFTVILCRPFEPNTMLYIDAHKLGTFGHHRPTGCMSLVIPGLNTPGKRLLRVGDLTRPILVFGHQNITK